MYEGSDILPSDRRLLVVIVLGPEVFYVSFVVRSPLLLQAQDEK
jgi:hypothetical protein